MTDGPDERPSWERDTEPTQAGASRDGAAADGAREAADAVPGDEGRGAAGTTAGERNGAADGARASDDAGASDGQGASDGAGGAVIDESVSAFDLLPGYEGGLTGPTLTRPGADEDAARRGHPPTGPDNEIITNVVDEVPVAAGEHSAFREVFGDLGITADGDDADAAGVGPRRSAGAAGPRRRGAAAPPERQRRDGRRILALCIVLAVLALVALFVFGTQLPRMLGAAPAPTPTRSATPTPTPTPTVTPPPDAAQEAGTHAWNTLAGGECIDPFSSPWAQRFTVVDCSAPHAAQLVAVGLLSTKIGDAYPGADAVAALAAKDCDRNGVIDLTAAADYSDLQVQASYPATEKQWDAGERTYYCFADLASGKQLTGSVAGGAPSD